MVMANIERSNDTVYWKGKEARVMYAAAAYVASGKLTSRWPIAFNAYYDVIYIASINQS